MPPSAPPAPAPGGETAEADTDDGEKKLVIPLWIKLLVEFFGTMALVLSATLNEVRLLQPLLPFSYPSRHDTPPPFASEHPLH